MKQRRPGRAARRLRVSIEALPPATKRAMLEGVRCGPIITGAYSSAEGTCPMLAAHRRGGRTSLATFIRAWDGYTGASRARLATERELSTLESMLVGSLRAEGAPGGASDLGRAIGEHRASRARAVRSEAATPASAPEPELVKPAPAARPHKAKPGDPDRTSELRARPGWAWLRVFRRLDDYEAALALAREDQDAPSERRRELAGVGADT